MMERKKTVSCTDFEEKKTSKESERKRPKMVKNLHTKAKKRKKKKKRADLFLLHSSAQETLYKEREREKHECTREKK